MVHYGKEIHNHKADNVIGIDAESRDLQHNKLSQYYFNFIATHNYLLDHMRGVYFT